MRLCACSVSIGACTATASWHVLVVASARLSAAWLLPRHRGTAFDAPARASCPCRDRAASPADRRCDRARWVLTARMSSRPLVDRSKTLLRRPARLCSGIGASSAPWRRSPPCAEVASRGDAAIRAAAVAVQRGEGAWEPSRPLAIRPRHSVSRFPQPSRWPPGAFRPARWCPDGLCERPRRRPDAASAVPSDLPGNSAEPA